MEQSTADPGEAPGLKRRGRSDGTAHYWVAAAISKHAKVKEYPLRTVRLHGDEAMIAHRCRVLTGELRQWLSQQGAAEQPPRYNGSVKSLIEVYRRTEESPYHTIKHSTRQMYDESLDLLETAVGSRQLPKLTGLDFRRWYNNLKEPAAHTEKEIALAKETGEPLPVKPERMRRAYKAMQLFRIIVKFGVVAGIDDCRRINAILDEMEFQQPSSRKEFITFDQAVAVVHEAIETGWLSIAIAQTLQFELTLRQIDVIGEWVPADGIEQQGIIDRGERWQGGLLWSHIDETGRLLKETTKTGTMADHDTKAYPFLRMVLDMVPLEKRIGPMAISEATGLPWRRREFAKKWRKIATKVGIPATVWNRDSRAGGVTEGNDAGADIEHLRHHANHSNSQTTSRYNRNTLTKTRKVAELRIAHRGGRND